VDHLPAAGDVADEHQNENCVKNDGPGLGLRSKIEKTVNDVGGVAGAKNSPAAIVRKMSIKDRDQPEVERPKRPWETVKTKAATATKKSRA